jgi:hypothetical protein
MNEPPDKSLSPSGIYVLWIHYRKQTHKKNSHSQCPQLYLQECVSVFQALRPHGLINKAGPVTCCWPGSNGGGLTDWHGRLGRGSVCTPIPGPVVSILAMYWRPVLRERFHWNGKLRAGGHR